MNDWIKNPLIRFLLIFIIASTLWFSLYQNIYKIERLFSDTKKPTIEKSVSINLGKYANFFTSILGYEPHLNTATEYVVTAIPEGKHTHGVWIGEPCNGIKVMGLFVIFIIAFSGSFKAKIWFIPLGIFIMHTANAIRISILTIIAAHDPSNLDFNHNVTFQIIMYGIVFGLWYWWVNRFSDLKSFTSKSHDSV